MAMPRPLGLVLLGALTLVHGHFLTWEGTAPLFWQHKEQLASLSDSTDADEIGNRGDEVFDGHFRRMEDDDMSGDAGSGGTDFGSGSGSGSGEAPSASPPPPEAPPPSPLSPGTTIRFANATRIVITLKFQSDTPPTPQDLDKVEQNVRGNLDCVETKGCTVVVTASESGGARRRLTAAERGRRLATEYDLTITVTAEQGGQGNATAVEANADALVAKSLTDLSATLFSGTTAAGAAITSGSVASQTSTVLIEVQVPAPSPPPPLPSPPPVVLSPPPPSTPPSEPPDASSGLEDWMIAVIVVAVVIVALVAGLVAYRLLTKRSPSSGINLESEKGGFPLAIGASTTQHV